MGRQRSGREGGNAQIGFGCYYRMCSIAIDGRSNPPCQHAAAVVLEGGLGWLQDQDHNPAIAALVEIDGRVVADAAIGRRALGHPQLVTADDRWHIGSDTKAFTATLITIRQLLSHTAGLPPLGNTETDFPTALGVVRSVRGVSAQRIALARITSANPRPTPRAPFIIQIWVLSSPVPLPKRTPAKRGSA
jgi:CubicO group peptidase (beta-lactamase class C family)